VATTITVATLCGCCHGVATVTMWLKLQLLQHRIQAITCTSATCSHGSCLVWSFPADCLLVAPKGADQLKHHLRMGYQSCQAAGSFVGTAVLPARSPRKATPAHGVLPTALTPVQHQQDFGQGALQEKSVVVLREYLVGFRIYLLDFLLLQYGMYQVLSTGSPVLVGQATQYELCLSVKPDCRQVHQLPHAAKHTIAVKVRLIV